MGSLSRTKGATFEREVAKFIGLELGFTLRRNLRQYQTATEFDLICDNPSWIFGIECKRAASGRDPLTSWKEQVVAAAEQASAMGPTIRPVIAYRFDGQHMRFAMPMSAIGGFWFADSGAWADFTASDWVHVAREILAGSCE